MGFVVVVCVISEAAGKAADRQKGKSKRQLKSRQSDTVIEKGRKIIGDDI